jgi:hypothetical protein
MLVPIFEATFILPLSIGNVVGRFFAQKSALIILPLCMFSGVSKRSAYKGVYLLTMVPISSFLFLYSLYILILYLYVIKLIAFWLLHVPISFC